MDQQPKELGIQIHGIDSSTPDAVARALAAGSRLVVYEYCISLIVVTLWRRTGVYCRPAGDRGLLRGLPYTLLSLLLGWWGIPWGFIYTPLTIITNLSGGRDVTDEVRALGQQGAPSPA